MCFYNITPSKNTTIFFCRAAGTFCIFLKTNIEKGLVFIKIPSGKFKKTHETSYVMLGRNSNIIAKHIIIGKAGNNIKKGFKPTVRGVAKNPVDHPHGGRTKTNSPERTP